MGVIQHTLDFGLEENKVQNGPVTVLGRTFANDEERRRIFREELRAKLPELRQIEGFPIGEDDDIINLSDPPYYTACPNPWLNDFIAEWEQEKEQLKTEGKREENFEVKEPYASDVSVGKNNPVYAAHTYHTKVPHPAIMRFILHYTQPGDIILDSFCGTGMTGVAARACGAPTTDIRSSIEHEWLKTEGKHPKWGIRHAICNDLSPYATSIAYNYNMPFDTEEFNIEAAEVIKRVKEKCKWLYATSDSQGHEGQINYVIWSDYFYCNNCGKEFRYWDVAMDFENKQIADEYKCPHCGTIHSKDNRPERVFVTKYDSLLKNNISIAKTDPVLMVYTCRGKRMQKVPDHQDLELLQIIEDTEFTNFAPIDELPEGEKTREPKRTHGYSRVHLYNTKRNSLALSICLDEFKKSKYGHILNFLFTGMINRSSTMNRIHVKNFFYGGGGWNAGHMKGTLYVPNLPVETSILEQLSDKLQSLQRALPYLRGEFSNMLQAGSANILPIIDNSIDYIFIDPPFGANIMYSELNYLVEAWLKVITNNNTEAIINRVQGKSGNFYQDLMTQSFREAYRVLKPGKWITVEFSNTKSSIWNMIQQALTSAGFVVASVFALDKKQGGMRAITTRTAVQQDLAITCYKPTDKLAKQFSQSLDTSENVWDFVTELLEHLPIHIERENKTTAIVERSPKILYDRLIAYYVQHGYPIPLDAQEFQQGLKERFVFRDGMFFNAEQAVEYDQKKHNVPNSETYSLFVDSEQSGIDWLKFELKDKPQTYQDIQPKWMQAMAASRKGDRIPELMDILKENFLEDEAGYWRIPDPEKEADLEKIRTKRLLREFDHYVEHANLAKSKKLKDARLEALRAGFKDCYQKKEFATIVKVGDKIPEALLTEDEILLQYYDIATSRA